MSNKFGLSGLTFKKFLKNRSGQITILMAVLLLPMTTFIGASLDWSQKITAESKMQSTLDSAILAVARQLTLKKKLTQAEMNSTAKTVFDTNISVSNNVELENFKITYKNDLLKISQKAKVSTTFLKLIDIQFMEIDVASEVMVKFDGVDIALAVDLSGSMKGNKIAHLRSATVSLVKQLAASNMAEARVAFIPWTVGVNVGSYYEKLAAAPPKPQPCYWRRNNRGKNQYYCPPNPPAPNDCIDLRPNGLMKANHTTINHPDTSDCPSAKLIPLTDLTKTTHGKTGEKYLSDIAKKWSQGGGTASHNGIYWAWATLTPAFWPVFGTSIPVDPKAVKKYAIIMTDGLNNDRSSDRIMIAACNAMKSQGILIYTIVLMENSQRIIDTYKACASSSASGREFFIQTNNSASLKDDFSQIVKEIGQFYLSK